MNRNIFLLSKDKGTLITFNTYITMCSSLAICIYIFSCSDVRLQVVIYLSVKQQVALSLSFCHPSLSLTLSPTFPLSLFSPTFSTSISPALPFSCSPSLSTLSLSHVLFYNCSAPPPPLSPFHSLLSFLSIRPSLLPSFPHSVRLALPLRPPAGSRS